MAFADDLKPVLHTIRAIPGNLGLRPHQVSIIVKSYTGTHTGEGDEVIIETAITEGSGQPPKVRWLKDDEIAVGNLDSGTIEVGPITPEFSTGGLDISVIDGSSEATGETRYLKIVGPKHPNGAYYAIKEVRADRAMHFKLRAVPVAVVE